MKSLLDFVAELFYYIKRKKNLLMSFLFTKEVDYKKIPIIINNRNRLAFLKMLIESLEIRGYENIIILDNNSTYEPLLEYYKTITCQVEYLGQNLGYDALEKIKLFKTIRRNYFVYTDSDVVPVADCPSDFLKHFLNTLKENTSFQKVGFSLKIDDLPDHYEFKHKVIDWESQFYQQEFAKGLFKASIDTTFALHRPYASLSTKGRFKHIRTGFPYSAYHMPWYNESNNLTEEEQFYINHVEIGTHWSKGLEVEVMPLYKRIFKFKSY